MGRYGGAHATDHLARPQLDTGTTTTAAAAAAATAAADPAAAVVALAAALSLVRDARDEQALELPQQQLVRLERRHDLSPAEEVRPLVPLRLVTPVDTCSGIGPGARARARTRARARARTRG